MVDSRAVAPFRRPFARALALLHVASAILSCELTTKTSDLEGGCPPHLPGPTLVKVDSGAGPYCIDSTEVTNGQYLAFFDSQGADATAHVDRDGCATVTTFRPDDPAWFLQGSDDLPVAHVNWCQAIAYCAWAGKRLCGKIGGGALIEDSWSDARVSQWVGACSREGTLVYPYGATFDPNACWGPGQHKADYVARHPGCQGGFQGIFDMSGNVWEWTDTCDPPASNNDFCRTMGGAFDAAGGDELACSINYRNWSRTTSAANIGFRCCLDL
jgi:formylglycine-generating enzyme required for sulfatase activity